VPLV
jgi:hypothetical protein